MTKTDNNQPASAGFFSSPEKENPAGGRGFGESIHLNGIGDGQREFITVLKKMQESIEANTHAMSNLAKMLNPATRLNIAAQIASGLTANDMTGQTPQRLAQQAVDYANALYKEVGND